jgi:hypothetical protein
VTLITGVYRAIISNLFALIGQNIPAKKGIANDKGGKSLRIPQNNLKSCRLPPDSKEYRKIFTWQRHVGTVKE